MYSVFCLILNLKPLYQGIRYKNSVWNGFFQWKISPRTFMVTINLRGAYLHIPMLESFQRYPRLAVEIEGKKYHFQSIGLSSSLRILIPGPSKVEDRDNSHLFGGPCLSGTDRRVAGKRPYGCPTMVEVTGVDPQHRQIKPVSCLEYPVFGISSQFNRSEEEKI